MIVSSLCRGVEPPWAPKVDGELVSSVHQGAELPKVVCRSTYSLLLNGGKSSTALLTSKQQTNLLL